MCRYEHWPRRFIIPETAKKQNKNKARPYKHKSAQNLLCYLHTVASVSDVYLKERGIDLHSYLSQGQIKVKNKKRVATWLLCFNLWLLTHRLNKNLENFSTDAVNALLTFPFGGLLQGRESETIQDLIWGSVGDGFRYSVISCRKRCSLESLPYQRFYL